MAKIKHNGIIKEVIDTGDIICNIITELLIIMVINGFIMKHMNKINRLNNS